MKKNLFYFIILIAVAAMPLTSCQKDEGPQKEEPGQHDPASDADQTPITTFDALSWLQGSLVVVNDNGEVIRRVYGEPLDESQPDVLSAPVADYAAAEKTFLSWVAPGKEVTKVEGGYDYHLTSADGKAQGSVSFRAVEGDARIAARMTVAEGTDLKKVREFEFICRDLWPENAVIPKVEAGKIYFYDDYVLLWGDPPLRPKDAATYKHIPFYCIQGNGDGKEGILVWLSPDSDSFHEHPTPYFYFEFGLSYLPTEPEAQKVLDFYNNNTEFWKNMLDEMEAKGYKWKPSTDFITSATCNSEFIINDFREVPIIGTDMTSILDLDDDQGYFSTVSSLSVFYYRYMHIKIFPAL